MDDAHGSAAFAVRYQRDDLMPRVQPGEFIVADPSRDASPGDEVLVETLDGAVSMYRLRAVLAEKLVLDPVGIRQGSAILDRDDVASLYFVAGIAKSVGPT